MRAICTSAPLQASTRVSPGFTLFRHSSPPFGSKQAHSNSTLNGPVGVEFKKCTPWMRSHLPFSTREVLATISSPLRVCLTPWSVFQDGSKKAVSARSHKPLRPASASERSFGKPRKINAPSNSDEPDLAFGTERPLVGYNFRTF